MRQVYAFWYELFCYDAISQFQVTGSVTIESHVQFRSRTFDYDYPDRLHAYHDRGYEVKIKKPITSLNCISKQQ